MEMTEITPEEAKSRLDAGGHVYLDVRTVAEFHAGRAPGALNVPVAVMNPAIGRMELNADFVRVVTAHLSQDMQIIVGCKSGQRSAAAIQILQQHGYTNLTNLAGGFGGVVDFQGQVIQEGWSTLGFPVERGPGENVSYEALYTRATQ